MASVIAAHRRRAGRQCIRTRLRLGQRIGADQFAARESREVLGFLRIGPEVDKRQRPNRRVRAERSAKRRVQRDLLADVRGADLVQAQAAVRRRNLEPGEVEIRRLP